MGSVEVVDTLTWRQVDFGGVVLAGITGGYLMALVGLWAGRVRHLVAIDIADYGRRYMVSDRASAWLLGFLSHLLNSILLVLLWAMVVLPNVHINQVLAGLLWGEILAVLLAGGMVGPLSGIGFMGMKTSNPRFALTNVLMHGVWGIVIGALYVAP
ncbi:MAG TPA: hypothetical protein VIK05_07115 [Ilumatobacteraceae bacterium]